MHIAIETELNKKEQGIVKNDYFEMRINQVAKKRICGDARAYYVYKFSSSFAMKTILSIFTDFSP